MKVVRLGSNLFASSLCENLSLKAKKYIFAYSHSQTILPDCLTTPHSSKRFYRTIRNDKQSCNLTFRSSRIQIGWCSFPDCNDIKIQCGDYVQVKQHELIIVELTNARFEIVSPSIITSQSFLPVLECTELVHIR